MTPGKKAAYYTLGCKLNFSETSTLARQLEKEGYARVDFSDCPDLFVINTCSVTDNADKKCRNIVNRALRNNPQAFVIVVGCYAQLKPQEITAIPGVDLVLGAAEKFDIDKYIQPEKLDVARSYTTDIKVTKSFVPSFSMGDRTRSFLKIQDGCNYFCAFCTIPLARGRSRSANVEDTLKEAQKIASTDVNEVVLTGVNIGDFGASHGENLLSLLRKLDKIEGISRYRISSIEPNLLSSEIIEFVARSQKFMPHFHIPLQSGSDVILKKMRRRYLTDLYKERIEYIKKLMPHACIGVDVITGFPSEGEDAFLETYEFLVQLDVSYLHVFTYSERDNTTALRLDEVVPIAVRQERSKKLRILSSKKKRAFLEKHVGSIREVLFESDNKDGFIRGFSDNYCKVVLPFDVTLVNSIRKTKLGAINFDLEMQGEIIETAKAK